MKIETIVIIDKDGGHNYYTGDLATSFKIECCKNLNARQLFFKGAFDDEVAKSLLNNASDLAFLQSQVSNGSRLELQDGSVWFFEKSITELPINDAVLKLEGGMNYEAFVHSKRK